MNKINRVVDVLINENTNKDITIIHISDLHFNMKMKSSKLDMIKEEIYKNNPDYVVITGDLLDRPDVVNNKEKIHELLVFLTDIGNFTKLLISIGNHDVFCDSDYKFFKDLNDLKNIYVLDNQSYEDEFIYISGITLPHNYYYNLLNRESVQALIEHLDKHKKLINKLPSDKPKVSLIHSPIMLTKMEVLKRLKEYDLILSGHTHEGVVPKFLSKLFPENGGIIAPNGRLFPEVARGKIEKFVGNNLVTIIISGGITKLSGCTSEVCSKFNFLYDISINKIIIKKGKR